MKLTELQEKVKIVGIVGIDCSLIINTKRGYMDIIVGAGKAGSILVTNQDMMALIKSASCIEANGEVYLRNPEKHNGWQNKKAIDYEADGGENTYATYGDSWILNKETITIIY